MSGKIVLGLAAFLVLVFGLAAVADGSLTENRRLRQEVRELRREHEVLVKWAQDDLRPWLIRQAGKQPPPTPSEPPVEPPGVTPTPSVEPPVDTPAPVPTPVAPSPSPTCIPIVELCL